jgi:hypothetical protein
MKARAGLLLLAALALPACLDPIVGTRCATGYSPCNGVCVAEGTCAAIDAGSEAGVVLDAGSIDGGIDAEPEVDGFVPMDAAVALDVGAVDGPGLGSVDTGVDSAPSIQRDARLDLPVRDVAPDAPRIVDVAIPDSPATGDAAPSVALDLAADSGDDAPDAECTECVDAAAMDAEPMLDGEAEDGPGEDAGVDTALVCLDPQIACNNQCVEPASDPENCGDCNVICATGVCLQGDCLVCNSDQSVCGQTCVNTDTDPDNCGGCGYPCMSGLCSNGVCEAAGTGRVIVIGHDYLNNRPAMNRILGNAVFLWPVNPVRLLTYASGADPAAVAGADAAIAQVAAATGRIVARTVATSVDVPSMLPTSDVFLVYAQVQTDDTTLAALGQLWASALDAFVAAGGTIVVLDAVSAANSGTAQILVQASLFDLTRNASATSDVCSVVARGDALATGLPRTYLCERNSMTFTVTDVSTTITSVVEDAGSPVVLHKVF